ncbi:hypothetical protein C1752_00270 [Acaryochloris thomasi RCC1774]|uniref:DUF4926 domain-containing protein n=1 Tax=Acaryochloris thomasi RCC1774 TaxID=1764569 RepID=A0A2W1K271_9CYAN|nr:DUF4926 domain-containing protein [Acaryochloris thomasi]PZD75494.1 hypothetical protein C1752_00270 [Acaryochloris thomasi RCC1774]
MVALGILDTIANLHPIPVDRLTLIEPDYQSIESLPSGQVGTIVEVYEGTMPRYLVEFTDLQGREYAMAVLQTEEVIALHYELSVMS